MASEAGSGSERSTDEHTNTSEVTGEKRPAEDDMESYKLKQAKYYEAKKELGNSFGTRKAQKQQTVRDSNIINTSNIRSIMGSIVVGINETAHSVPSKADMKAKQDAMRPIPTYHLDADTPQDAYRLQELILPAEIESMKPQISLLKKAQDEKSQWTPLACRRSTYVSRQLQRVFNVSEGQKPDSKRLRIIYFLSLLIGFYKHRMLVKDKGKLSIKLFNPPSDLLTSLISRFSERDVVDLRNADRILTHIFVLGLHLDNFSSEIKAIQEDLELRPPQIVTLYKELGCTVSPLTETQRLAANLTKAQAKSLKCAVLKTPLKLPDVKRGGPARR